MKFNYYYFLYLVLFVSCKHQQKDPTPAILNFVNNTYLSDEDLSHLDPEYNYYQYEVVDLNGDGKQEYMIAFSSSYFCGSGGCTFILLDSNFSMITKFTVTQPPVYIDTKSTHGWNNLLLWSNGNFHTMHYDIDVQSYPSNPSVEPIIKVNKKAQLQVLFDGNSSLEKLTFQ